MMVFNRAGSMSAVAFLFVFLLAVSLITVATFALS